MLKFISFLFPVVRLGLFNFGFSDAEQETTTTRSGNQRETSSQTQTSTRRGTQESTGLETLTQLPTEVQAALTSLALSLAQDTGGEVSNLAAELNRRAGGADQALQDSIQRIVADRENAGRREIDQQVARLAASTGSSQNSFVQQVGFQANEDLQKSLAGIQGQLEIEARKQATNEFATALSGQSSQQTDLINVVNALRGATTTRETTGTQTNDETQKVLADLSRVLNSTSTGVSETEKSGFSFGFGL